MSMKRKKPLRGAKEMACALMLITATQGEVAAQRAEMPGALRRFVERPIVRGASVSFVAKRVKDGKTLYSYEGDRQLTPASVMKTVTTATALELLGEDFRFETTVEYDGELRPDGVLDGNL